jgi:hypothetical protein
LRISFRNDTGINLEFSNQACIIRRSSSFWTKKVFNLLTQQNNITRCIEIYSKNNKPSHLCLKIRTRWWSFNRSYSRKSRRSGFKSKSTLIFGILFLFMKRWIFIEIAQNISLSNSVQLLDSEIKLLYGKSTQELN